MGNGRFIGFDLRPIVQIDSETRTAAEPNLNLVDGDYLLPPDHGSTL